MDELFTYYDMMKKKENYFKKLDLKRIGFNEMEKVIKDEIKRLQDYLEKITIEKENYIKLKRNAISSQMEDLKNQLYERNKHLVAKYEEEKKKYLDNHFENFKNNFDYEPFENLKKEINELKKHCRVFNFHINEIRFLKKNKKILRKYGLYELTIHNLFTFDFSKEAMIEHCYHRNEENFRFNDPNFRQDNDNLSIVNQMKTLNAILNFYQPDKRCYNCKCKLEINTKLVFNFIINNGEEITTDVKIKEFKDDHHKSFRDSDSWWPDDPYTCMKNYR